MLWIALQAWHEDHLPAPDKGVLQALAWQALAFTPRVALASDAALMEVSASLRLFGGLSRLLRGLHESMRELLQPSRLHAAPGPQSLVALGRLRLAQPWKLTARLPVHRLPLAVLDAAQPHLDVLARLGCQTWGDVRGLPRDGLARRFGAPLLEALDQAFGDRPESHCWLQLPQVFEDHLELPFLVEHSSGLLFALQRLLQRLKAWLAARKLGVLAVRLVWHMDARRSLAREGQLLLRLGEATQDMGHLARLAAEHLARVQLPAPAQSLSLHSLETVALDAPSLSLLIEDAQRGDSLGQLMERLSARLGPAQVLRCQLRASHVPERMQQWQRAFDGAGMADPSAGAQLSAQTVAPNKQRLTATNRPEGRAPTQVGRTKGPAPVEVGRAKGPAPASVQRVGSEGARPSGRSSALRPGSLVAAHRRAGMALADKASELLPTWLLHTPLPLPVQGHRPCFEGPLTLLVGPQRLETSGWHGLQPGQGTQERSSLPPVMRDYFIARSAHAGLLWIFRERLPRNQLGGWFLHGLFA